MKYYVTLLLIIIIVSFCGCLDGNSERDNNSSNIEYHIFDTENFDVLNLSRRAYYVEIPYTTTVDEIKLICQKIIESRDYDRIWIYFFYNRKNSIGLGYTVAMCDYEDEFEYNFRKKITNPGDVVWPTAIEYEVFRKYAEYGYGEYYYLSETELITKVGNEFAMTYTEVNNILLKVTYWWYF